MSKAFIYDDNPQIVFIKCPACGYLHGFDERWTFNGDFDKPTFTPSMMVNGSPDMAKYLNDKDGRIQFLSDCSHEMAGQTVDLPEIKK